MQGEDDIYLRESLINMDGRMEFASSVSLGENKF